METGKGWLALVLVSAICHPALAATGIVPIRVSNSFASAPDQPYVSVTLCEPGTQNCQTIDNIQLDTGSNGLRIFSSLVHLNLKSELSQDGGEVVECMDFGGGWHSNWGPVKTVDVLLGDEKIPRTPVQFVDSTYASIPSTCVNADQKPIQSNGILGIREALTDCDGDANCDGYNQYFSCSGKTCIDITKSIPTNLQLPNPIMNLPKYNNGFSITFPSVPNAGEKEVMGKWTLGINSNSPTAASINNPALKKLTTDDYGQFKVEIDGTQYTAGIDSGSGNWLFPSKLNFPSCTGEYSPLICPASPINISVDVLGDSDLPIDTFNIEVDDGQKQYTSGNAALEDLGINGPGGLSDMFLAGIPFFFGRTIYFAYKGHQTPIGPGPFVAYVSNKK